MHYEERAPGPELAPWVQAFWRLRCERPYALRIVPDGCMDIIGGDVVGLAQHALVADLEAGDEASGIRLRPGAFTALYGVPAERAVGPPVPLGRRRAPAPTARARARAPPPDPLAAAALAVAERPRARPRDGYSSGICAVASSRRPATARSAWRASRACRGPRSRARRELGAHRGRFRLPRRVAHDQRHPRARPARPRRRCSPSASGLTVRPGRQDLDQRGRGGWLRGSPSGDRIDSGAGFR